MLGSRGAVYQRMRDGLQAPRRDHATIITELRVRRWGGWCRASKGPSGDGEVGVIYFVCGKWKWSGSSVLLESVLALTDDIVPSRSRVCLDAIYVYLHVRLDIFGKQIYSKKSLEPVETKKVARSTIVLFEGISMLCE